MISAPQLFTRSVRTLVVSVSAFTAAAALVVGPASLRAQISEDPATVAAGHTKVELDFSYTHEHEDGVTTRAFNSGPLKLTYGLNDRSDVQASFDGHQRVRTRSAGVMDKAGDWGDLTLGVKYNFVGHDVDTLAPGRVAFAALPYVVLPLKFGDSGSDQVRGGVLLPLAIGLPAEMTLLTTTEFDCVASRDDTGREFQWVQTLALCRGITANLSAYAELYSALPAEPRSDWTALANIGVSYACCDSFCIEACCAFGLSRAAPDVQPAVRLTYLY